MMFNLKRRIAFPFFLLPILLGLLGLGACRKSELPPDMTENPYFKGEFLLELDSNRLLEAGRNNRYLFTRAADSGSNLRIMWGAFAPATCPTGDCVGSLRFEFYSQRDPGLSPEQLFRPDSGWAMRRLSLADTIYLTELKADNTGGFTQFKWNINQTNSLNGIVVNTTIPDRQPEIELRARHFNGWHAYVRRRVDLADSNLILPKVQLRLNNDSINGIFSCEALTTGFNGAQFLWSDGTTDSSTLINANMNNSISVRVTDAFGGFAEARIDSLFAAASTPFLNTPEFTFKAIPEINTSNSPTGFALQWVDENGKRWRSDIGPQLPDTRLFIEQSAPYEKNENGKATRELDIFIQCRLYADTGLSRNAQFVGKIAVATE